MHDPAPERGPSTRAERWTYGLFLGTILSLFVAEIFTNYTPVKLSALFILLFWIPLLALHEAGHALAAKLLNWRVGEIVIGVGTSLKTFRLGNALVDIRILPVAGFVKCVPTDLKAPRLKNALIYFAGPGMDLLSAALVLLILGPDRLFSHSDHYGIIACQSLALAGTTQAVLNLLPYSANTHGQTIVNDGLGILQSFTLPDRYFAEQIAAFREQGYDYFRDQSSPKPPPDNWWDKERRL